MKVEEEMSSNVSQLHANAALKGLLVKMLPGAVQDTEGGSENLKPKPKASRAQLIDRSLKRRIELQDQDMKKSKKRQSRLRRRNVWRHRRNQHEIRKLAELEVFERHRREAKLTKKEKKYLNRLISVNGDRARSWEMDEDDKDDLLEMQKYILEKTANARITKDHNRRQKTKSFNENKKPNSPTVSPAMTRRYPGLTPGLAPVDLSDEDESTEEEEMEIGMDE